MNKADRNEAMHLYDALRARMAAYSRQVIGVPAPTSQSPITDNQLSVS